MKFEKFLEEKARIKEDTLNEAGGDPVDFGPFIDNLAVGAWVGAGLIIKGIHNKGVYNNLLQILPKYIEIYKLTEAPKSKTLYDLEFDEKYISPVQKEIDKLVGKAGSKKNETSFKDKIAEKYKNMIDAANDEKKKDILRSRRDATLQGIDAKVEMLKNKIELLNAKSDVEWEKMKEEWRKFSESFDEKTKEFLEVQGSILASSWRKKWDKEFTIAKNQADIEVLDKTLKLAAEQKNVKQMEEIAGSKEKAEERMKAAQKDLDELEKETQEAKKEDASAEEMGVNNFVMAKMDHGQPAVQKEEEWSKLANVNDKEEKNESLKFQEIIQKLRENLSKVQNLNNTSKNRRIREISSKIDEWQEESLRLGSSMTYSTYYSLVLGLSETIKEIQKISEADESTKKIPTLDDLIKIMDRAIKKAPEEEKTRLLDKAISDIMYLWSAKQKELVSRNEMVKKFRDNQKKEADKRKKVSSNLQIFSKLKEVDVAKEEKPYKEAIEKYAKQKEDK